MDFFGLPTSQESISRTLANNVSEIAKRLGNEPMYKLHLVQQHIHVKLIRDQVVLKEKLLTSLTKMREAEQSEKHDDITNESFINGGKALDHLTERIDALRERIEIVSGIQEQIGSFKNKKKHNLGEDQDKQLPVGVGQLLDQTLINGEIDVDQYVLQMSQLQKAYNELSAENDEE